MNEPVTTAPLAILSPDVRYYVDNALSSNSRLAYKSDFAHFKTWGGVLPSSPEQVASYITAFAGQLSIATIQRRISSISRAHQVAGYPSPTKSELVRLTFRGIRREHGKAQRQAKALIKEDLLTILRQMPETTKARRDEALLVIGFAAGLRRSELVGLDVSDITFVAQGLTLQLRHSKTDKLHESRSIAIPFGRMDVCPVKILKTWLDLLPEQSGAIFRSIKKGGAICDQRLSDKSVSDIVKQYVKQIGLNPDEFSGHSCRAGLVSSCAMANVASWIIKRTTGHRSEEMIQKYIRPVENFTYNASGFLF